MLTKTSGSQQNLKLSFPDDAAWRQSITSVLVGNYALRPGMDYVIANGTILFTAAWDPQLIKIIATGYKDAVVN
ncbi:hypothetical protein BRE01_48540 [Brevibacillus reuszeri]|uniref:Heme-binding protein Shr-like Hb-interacting domain-containing protein n=1 Tax=Brevibacillus reuszeri TaxID=54915 RepID=A0A0K9YYR8_9BACL|nr:hypothetical protein ADS79_07585 [Brevibacillus reuszeri]GED71152.1 hypothetical protein BRE01_48540 [Brevibacillus reuszeri]